MPMTSTDFLVRRAQCEISRALSYQVRHQVYCEELGFEPCNARRLETDCFDSYADHFIIMHQRTGFPAGTVRLIVPRQDEHMLPIERFLTIAPPRHTICEVSRIAVPGWLRDRTSPQQICHLTEQDRKQIPLLSLILALCSLFSANEHQREHVYVLMERRLARQLSRFGFHFSPCGDPISLNGERIPHYTNIHSINRSLLPEIETLYRQLQQQLQIPFTHIEAISA